MVHSFHKGRLWNDELAAWKAGLSNFLGWPVAVDGRGSMPRYLRFPKVPAQSGHGFRGLGLFPLVPQMPKSVGPIRSRSEFPMKRRSRLSWLSGKKKHDGSIVMSSASQLRFIAWMACRKIMSAYAATASARTIQRKINQSMRRRNRETCQ